MKSFSGDALRVKRLARGFTQKSLSKAIETHERTLQRWEAGEFEPSATYLLRILICLDCSAEDLQQ